MKVIEGKQRAIEQFLARRFDEDGVARTIHIDECDRAEFARELTSWLTKSPPGAQRSPFT